MTPHLTVCGIHELGEILEDGNTARPVTHIISIWDPPADRERRQEIEDYHDLFARTVPDDSILTLYFDDIPQAVMGFTAPNPDHMSRVLDFAHGAIEPRSEETHLLVHCHMGISRSTACAMAVLAATNPHASSASILSHLLGIRPWISPNPLLVRFADELLERDDSLLSAVLAHREGDPGD